MDELLTSLDTYLDQFSYYQTVKMPDVSEINNINKVVVCAMGGSAFPVEIVADHIKAKYRRDVVILCKDYALPYWVDGETLVIAMSFSGSTEETLSCMNEALERKIPVIGISMGGEISRICSEKKLPYIALPKVVMPRFGSGYAISALMRALVEIKLIPQQSEEMDNIKIMLEPVKVYAKKEAQALAKKNVNRILTVYTDVAHVSAGNIARICINETAKMIGYNNVYSESNHNELASFADSPYAHGMFLLTYPEIRERIVQRFDLLKELMPDKDFVYSKVNCNFSQILYRDVYFTMFFSYLSAYLAVESEHDPIGTPTQDQIKLSLKALDK